MERKNLPQNKVLRILMTLLLFIFISSVLAHAVSAVNNPPVFTSGDSFWVDENTVYVTTITANDSDSEDNITGYEVIYRDSSTMDSRHFQITNDGVLSFISPPDFENPTNFDPDKLGLYRLAVKVTSGSGSRERTAINRYIYVIVGDVDEFLSFSQNLYTFNLNESEKGNLIPLLLGSVNATSNDNLSNEIIYSITQGNTSKFNINRSNGQITYIGNGEDYESGKIQYNLTVQANDSVNNATANIIVYVNAVNEPPVFSQNSYTFNLDENADGSSNPISVGNVTATDEENDSVNYSITQGNTSKFNIDRSNGQITYIGNGEDYESGTTQYTLMVSANDSVNEETAQIIININNLNDNSPVFNQSSYTFRLDEKVVGNSTPVSLGNVTATDEDRDILTYSITQGDTDKFDINPSNGEITYIGSGEDYESGTTQYTLTVTANDSTSQVNAQVTVNVNNVNEPPVFDQNSYTFDLDENEDGSTNPVYVDTVNAADVDNGDNVEYSISAGDTNKFSINSTTGDITYIGSGEDYESGTTQYTLTVTADDGTSQVNAQVTVNVNNVNEPPVFDQNSYTFDLDENEDGSTNPVYVDTVNAADVDNGDNVEYSISAGDTNKFSINSTTGDITYIGTGENYESGTTQYTLTVTADDGTNQVDVQVTVDINDLNENTNEFGFEKSAYTFSIDENEDGSSTPVNLGTVKAVNNESTVTYSISAEDNNKFSINSQTGVITYIGNGEDYESGTTQYTLTVNANDTISQVNAQVTVNVDDVNEPPVFEQNSYSFDLDENVNGSSTPVNLGTVTAEDEDSGDNMEYSISAGDNNKFSINSQTGEITYIGSGEDYESGTTQYTLTVTADDGTNQVDVQVTVDINDLNENTNTFEFEKSAYTFSIDENVNGSSNPVNLGTVKAVNNESTVTYSISTGDTNKFAINSTTGTITYIGSGEDYETDNQYNLTVTADDGTNEVNVQVTVNINDLNENTEEFEFEKNAYTFNLDENEDGSSTPVNLGTVKAINNESSITYSISAGDTNKFSINFQTGEITYIGSGEDHETDDQYTLTINADDGTNQDTTQVTIDVNDVNEQPVFEQNLYTFNIDENVDGSSNPVFIGKVTAEDPDTNDVVTYTMTYGDTNKFNINSTTGVITYIGNGEDYEGNTFSYALRINAYDGEIIGEILAEVNVNVENVSEPPVFEQNSYTFNIDENVDGSSNPVFIGKVTAEDDDFDSVLEYSLSTGDTSKFKINSTNGNITYTGTGEDYETNNTFYLTVMVDDGESSSVTVDVTININNLNDEGEFGFDRSSYVFSLDENEDGSSTPVSIDTVNAINNNDTITYSISSGDTDKFNISSTTGEITYIGTGEDYENGIIQYNLTLTANDGVNESTVNATININDLDDNKPPIARDDTIEIISGDTISVLLGGDVSVRDNDEDEDNLISQLTVTLISDASYGNLKLNEDGTFTYRHYGNSTTEDNFEYSISDGINSSSATVTISVQVDTSAPNITITSPANGLSTTNTTQEISFIATDNTSPEAFKPLKFKIFVDNTLVEEKVGNSDTAVSYTLSELSIDSHTFWVEATDPAGNSQNSSKITININTNTSSDSSEDEDRGNSGTRLYEGEPKKFKIKSGGSSVELIEVEANERVNNVKIKAKKIRILPSSIEEVSNGEVYEYIDITASRLDDDEIADATIEFIVEKEWLSDNGFDKEEVVLLRYNKDDDEWEELDTEIILETSTYVRYSADTSEFSTFAIAGIKKPKPTPVPTTVEPTPVPIQTETQTVEPPTPVPTEPTPVPTPNPAPNTIPKGIDVPSYNNQTIIIFLIVVTLLVLITAVFTIIKKSRGRRSRVKRKIKLPTQSPTISLGRPTLSARSMPIQYTSTKHLKKTKQRKPIATTILSGALGIILALIALVSYRVLSPESIDVSLLGSVSINTILIFSLIMILSAIFTLSFKIIRNKSNYN